MSKNADYISKGIVLHRETWAKFDKLRKVHGSYNKALIAVLNGAPVGGEVGQRPTKERK